MSKAVDGAYKAIREAILAGDLVPGSRLPEVELSSRIGVSRTPVREALRRLAAEGMVDFLPNRGAHVASWTESQLEEIFELRGLLEGHAASRSATRISAEELAQLSRLADAMEATAEERSDSASFEIAQLNNEFHQLILGASGSRHLETATLSIVQIALVHQTFARYTPRALERSFAHHRELIDALTAGDADWARSVMQSHILAARHILSSTAGGEIRGSGEGAGSSDVRR
ncbi:MAG: GntR family transcriptional regulator [Nitriliruptoraceae bacterium]